MRYFKIMQLIEKLREQEKVCQFKFESFLSVVSHVTSFAYLVQAKWTESTSLCV